VRLFLEHNDVDFESNGRTALLCAAGGWVKFKYFARHGDLQHDGQATLGCLRGRNLANELSVF
jgi:hypothetical protein